MTHGSRPSYVAGCRCTPCRAGNAATVAAYRQQPAPLLDAGPILAHLHQLHALGLGARQIARLAGLGAQVIRRLTTGQQTRLRAATAAALLGVRPTLARGARVPGTRTWRFVDSLEREGFTRRQVAFALGAKSQQLQLQRRVTVATALKVATVYARLTT
jgi:hypothetical protein